MQRPASTSAHNGPLNGLGTGTVEERRAQIEHEETIARAERRRQLDAQRSNLSPARERINLWERLHALHLPRNASHKLLEVIARETELTVADIQQEQLRRNAGKLAINV